LIYDFETLQRLANLLDDGEPLGPIDQEEISDLGDARAILFEDAPAFASALSKDATLIIGRKGAGKSSIIAEYKIAAASKQERQRTSASRFDRTRIIEIETWDRFFEMVKAVSSLMPHETDPMAVLTPPEFVAQLWERVIWEEIIKHYFEACTLMDGAGLLSPVCAYLNPTETTNETTPPNLLADKLYEEAKKAILNHIGACKERCLVLFDNMDDFPVKNLLFRKVTAGFLKCLVAFNRKYSGIMLIFCLPEEVEFAFSESSSNTIKDYQKAHWIHWRPIDLLRITGHRYRLLTAIKDFDHFVEIEPLDFEKRADIHALFDRLLPGSITNATGQEEDPLAYIIRHTQLLPRHIIFFFNEILRRSFRATGGFREVQPNAVVEGVKEVEEIVAKHVLTPYLTLYPRLITACKDILPDLEPITDYGELKKIGRRFKSVVEDDVGNVWHKLFEMGILGRVVPQRENCPDFIIRSRYVLGAFHYNIDGSFSLATDGEYCFHPIFSSYFGLARRNPDDRRTVYPANVDDVTLGGLVG
jgi:hypothetical protein